MFSIKLTSKGKWNVLKDGAVVGTIERIQESAPVMSGRLQVGTTRRTVFALTCGSKRIVSRRFARNGAQALEDFQLTFAHAL